MTPRDNAFPELVPFYLSAHHRPEQLDPIGGDRGGVENMSQHPHQDAVGHWA